VIGVEEVAEMVEALEDVILRARARLVNVVMKEELPSHVRQELFIALGRVNLAYNLVLNIICKLERKEVTKDG